MGNGRSARRALPRARHRDRRDLESARSRSHVTSSRAPSSWSTTRRRRFRTLDAIGRRVAGTVVDGVGPIARIEASVTGTDEWVPFFPQDGVFDEPREEFDADLSTIAPNGHALIAIRAYDHAGNFVVRNVSLK